MLFDFREIRQLRRIRVWVPLFFFCFAFDHNVFFCKKRKDLIFMNLRHEVQRCIQHPPRVGGREEGGGEETGDVQNGPRLVITFYHAVLY